MGGLSNTEQETVERAAAEPMREQVLAWSALNSGSRNLDGLADMAATSPTHSRLCRVSLGSKSPRRSKPSTPADGPSTSSTAGICT